MAETEKTIFITGVSSGIGHGLARYYLDRGDRVFGISRRTPEDLLGSESFSFGTLDVRDSDAIEPAIRGLLAKTQKIDLVILNAGVLGEFGDLRLAKLDDLRNTMFVNVWANKLLMDALLSCGLAMEQVVTISSGASVNGNRGWSGYSISKAALNMLTKLLAAENPEIHFAALAPGLVDTAMQDELCGREPDPRFPALEF